ncbi:hypothetical protein Ae717Ps2_5789c [Pseudonocardia sp. Ae717_Ps2]|nr:hypothetical protein Ae717Ps2_5789c [Pseudonocardia sp. Ae717_Ps2]
MGEPRSGGWAPCASVPWSLGAGLCLCAVCVLLVVRRADRVVAGLVKALPSVRWGRGCYLWPLTVSPAAPVWAQLSDWSVTECPDFAVPDPRIPRAPVRPFAAAASSMGTCSPMRLSGMLLLQAWIGTLTLLPLRPAIRPSALLSIPSPWSPLWVPWAMATGESAISDAAEAATTIPVFFHMGYVLLVVAGTSDTRGARASCNERVQVG